MAGIYRKGAVKDKDGRMPADARIADFSYQNDVLAQMIVYAWSDQTFRDQLTEGTDLGARSRKAKQALAERGFYLDHPIVITETEYNNDYAKNKDDEVVFVLPNPDRKVTPPQGQSLLETARLLMACTPHGI